MNLLALDPGIRGVGLSYFDTTGTLQYADYIGNPIKAGRGPESWFALGDAVYTRFKELGYRVDLYVCEVPQVYRFSKGDPNDLIELSAVAAACGASFQLQRVVGYKPREWKGQLQKEVHHPRILGQLSDAEKATIKEKRKTYLHNVIDAIGLGLYELERMRVRLSK